MKTLKKLLSIGLIAVMAVSLMCGCSSENEETVDGATKITVWTNSAHTKDVMTELVNEYNKTTGKEKGIYIDYTVYGSDYQQVYDVAAQTESLPDLFYAVSGAKNAIDMGTIAALDDMPGGSDFIAQHSDRLLPGVNVFEGKTYTVPYNLTTVGLIYNKDLFKANGIVDENGEAKAPTTWDEVAEYAKKCTDTSKNVYGIALPLKWGGYLNWELLHPWFATLGTEGYDYDNQKYDYTVLKPAFEWLLKIKKDKSFYIGAEGLDNDPARAQFSEGNVAMKLAASWDVGVLNDQFPAKCDWGVAPVPSLDGNPKYKQWTGSDAFLAISSKIDDAKKEKVMEVYKWFHEKEVIEKLYVSGKIIPADGSIVDGVTLDENTAKNWEEFSSMSEISVSLPTTPAVAVEGDTLSTVMMKMWIGDVEIDEGLKDITKRMNAALEKEKGRGTLNFEHHTWGDVDKNR